jgi:hypothetical protein
MPADDRHWYPRVLDGDLLARSFHFANQLQSMSMRALDRLNDDEPNPGYKPPHEHHASGRQRRFLGTSGNARFAGSSGSPRLAGSGGGSTRLDCVSSACPPRACSIASRAAMVGLVTAWQPAPVPERVGPRGELRASEHRHNARRHRRRRVLGLQWLLLEWGGCGCAFLSAALAAALAAAFATNLDTAASTAVHWQCDRGF